MKSFILFLGFVGVFVPSTCHTLAPPSAQTLANLSNNASGLSSQLGKITHYVVAGESIASIFKKYHLSAIDLNDIIYGSKQGKRFANISPGKKLIITHNSRGKLQSMAYHKNSIDALQAQRVSATFKVSTVSQEVSKELTNLQVTIRSSLFLDGKEAGMTDKMIMQLAGIFGWDIDFAVGLRKDDHFTIVYEKLFINGKNIGDGNILSAEFVNRGRVYTALRFIDERGVASYFTPKGKSMRKAFLRNPIDFTRISSKFNLKRKHPVLNRIRAHKGVDYAAKTGTPIKTTGDGKIIWRGRKGGYGRVVIVRHGQKYSTLYAHLRRYQKRQRVGSHVKQGEVIGFVGSSGLATGPHLHYEFRINGVHKNPLTVRLPQAKPIAQKLFAVFQRQTTPLVALLATAKQTTQIAQSKP